MSQLTICLIIFVLTVLGYCSGIFFIVPFIQTQFMSNRGTMLIYHSIAIATCAATGSNPIGLMILIQAACLSAYMTPSATSAIPYIMGYGGFLM